MFEGDSLLSKYYQQARPGKYVRHDLRIWESSHGRDPRVRDDRGEALLGDALLDDWRSRARTGAARMRAYYDVIPARESALTLDPSRKNPWGDPLPRIDFVDSDWTTDLRETTEGQIRSIYEKLASAGGGKILSVEVDDKTYDHPGGGCRMGDDPATSVVDRLGRSHDHENLWVVGAPTIVSAGCNNGTLTFAALTLRTASAMRAS
jgi:quinoprotein glucose dehydrogenase